MYNCACPNNDLFGWWIMYMKTAIEEERKWWNIEIIAHYVLISLLHSWSNSGANTAVIAKCITATSKLWLCRLDEEEVFQCHRRFLTRFINVILLQVINPFPFQDVVIVVVIPRTGCGVFDYNGVTRICNDVRNPATKNARIACKSRNGLKICRHNQDWYNDEIDRYIDFARPIPITIGQRAWPIPIRTLVYNFFLYT